MNAEIASVGRQLFELQPEGTQITLRACQWAVRRAENALSRTLHPTDLRVLGSKLSAPLLLLASTRIKHTYGWTSEHRWFVACALLERLAEEGGGS